MNSNQSIKERIILFLIFSILLVISLILILTSAYGSLLNNIGIHELWKIQKYTGITGIILFAISIFLVISKTLVNKSDKNNTTPSTSLLLWDKIFEKLHIPLSMIGLAIIGYHIYLAFHLGWKWNTGYIFGLLAAIFLLLSLILGILRIFNKGITAHKHTALTFLVLALIHLITI